MEGAGGGGRSKVARASQKGCDAAGPNTQSRCGRTFECLSDVSESRLAPAAAAAFRAQ